MSLRRDGCFLFLCFALVYAATSPGDVIGDTEMRWLIAKRLVDTGWFDLAPGTTDRYVEGRDGRQYFFTGAAQPVCLAPFVVAGRMVARLPLGFKADADLYGQFLASLLFFPICGALTVILVHSIVREATGDRRVALWTAVIFGLGTMHWHNSINTYEESQTAVCALTSLWASQRAWQRGGWVYPWLAMVAAGVGLCLRVSSITLSVPICVIGFAHDVACRADAAARARRVGAWMIAGLAGLAPFLAILVVFNVARFGSPLETGYGLYTARALKMGLFDTPLLTGLGGMLLSPGKSVFLFNPVLLLAIPGFLGLWRLSRPLALVVISTFAFAVLFHARYTFWAGDLAWGPRYLASGMGIWMLALVPILRVPRWRSAMASLVVLSICVQLASVVYGFGLEFFQDGRHGTVPDGYVWRPAESQLFCRFRNITLHIAGRPDFHSIPPLKERRETYQVVSSPRVVRQAHAIAFFPFKARSTVGSASLFRVLLAAWIATLVALCGLVLMWRPWRVPPAPQMPQ